MSQFVDAKPLTRKQVKVKGQLYYLNIMPAEPMFKAHLFGFAKRDEVYISETLKGRVRAFVIKHEVYHLNDKSTWLGYFGLELRSNLSCGLRDPIGLLATITAGLRHLKLKAYVKAMLGRSDKA